MKKIKLLTPIMALSVMPMLGMTTITSCSNKDGLWELTNPDRSLYVGFDLTDKGTLTYKVWKDNKVVVDTSTLGMKFNADANGQTKEYDFSKGLKFVKITSNEKRFSYDCLSGKTDHVNVHYKEKVITTKVDDLFMDVIFRSLNDGYGFQYSFYTKDNSINQLTWVNEFTEFNIPTNSTTYGMDYEPNYDKYGRGPFYSYETHYNIRDFKNITNDDIVSMPFSYEANGYYSMITESGLIGSGYHGSFLNKKENNILTTVHAPAGGESPDYSVDLPFNSPWRVSSVGSYATTFETTIVDDILGDIDPYLPKDETDPEYYEDWVEPGIASWSWLLHHEGTEHEQVQGDPELQTEYINLSANMGWKYVLFDAGWEDLSKEVDVKDFIADANDKGVKVLAWAHAMDGKFNDDAIDQTIAGYAELGLSGLKVDFWDGNGGQPEVYPKAFQMEDKQNIQRYERLYKAAADNKLIINCHGCNKPTGERRMFPNVLNREGLRGNEFNTVYAPQGVLLSLTRGVVGPSDFTPVVKPIEHDVTIGYQMAMPIILESGTPSMGDLSEVYIKNDGTTPTAYTDFYKNLPAAWDRSIFLGGNPKEYVVVARKKGDNWWIAGITTSQRVLNLNFSFLNDGDYSAKIYNGGSRAHADEGDIEVTTVESLNKNTNRLIKITDNGGFVIEIKKQ